MFRFVGTKPDGLPLKRNQSARACELCRKRKKRCTHMDSVDDNDAANDTIRRVMNQHVDSIATPESSHLSTSATILHSTVQETPSVARAESEHDDYESGRYVGDLNPESIFLSATSPQIATSPDEGSVGIWLPRGALEGIRNRLSGGSVSSSSTSSDPLLTNIVLPYMQRQCLQLLPSPENYLALQRVYVKEIHPIFPILDLDSLAALNANAPTAIVMKQAVCLAASTSPRAIAYFQSSIRSPSQPLQTQASYNADQLSSAIRTCVDMGFVKDRMVIAQVLGVLSLFTYFSRQSHLSAETTARAISHIQTLGLHLGAPSTKKDPSYVTKLFCCILALDKLNAAFHGRPTAIHERDFGRDLKSDINKQEGAFRLFLRLIVALDEVITLYRPKAEPLPDLNIKSLPTFEQLIYECDATRVSAGHLATIETLYHAITILSCRSRNMSQASIPPEIRETHSAASLVSIIGTEFPAEISHFPIVPYSLSLSLRVFYRELRFSSKSPFSRNRTRKQLIGACELLRTFSDTFPATLKMIGLAEQTVKEMDKAYTNILKQQSSRSNSEPIDTNTSNHHHGRPPDVSQVSDAQNNLDLAESEADAVHFDPGSLEDLPDLDVFDYFDSDFNLDVVDAAFVENMNLAFPTPSDDTYVL